MTTYAEYLERNKKMKIDPKLMASSNAKPPTKGKTRKFIQPPLDRSKINRMASR